MSGTTTFAKETGDTSAASTTEAITSAQQEMLQSVGVAGAAMLESLTKVQTDIADFITKRICQDVDLSAEMLRCRTLDDICTLQTHFFRTAVDQYAAEVSRLMRISTDTVQRSFVTRSQ
jgi:hypothetical protein